MPSDLSDLLHRVRHPGRTPRREDLRAWLDELAHIASQTDADEDRSVITGTIHRLQALECQLNADPNGALKEVEHALSAYGPDADLADMARTMLCRGNAHYALGQLSDALRDYTSARDLFDADGDLDGLARTIGNIGNVHNVAGDHSAALGHYREAFGIHDSMGDKEGMARTLGGSGLALANMASYAEAMADLTRALDLWKAVGDRREEARVLNGLANVYRQIGDYATALEYFHDVQHVVEELGDTAGLARVLLNIAGIHGDISDGQRQLEYCLRAIELNERTSDKASHPRMLASVAAAYNSLGDHASALPYIERAVTEDVALGMWSASRSHSMLLATILVPLGRTEESKAIAERVLVESRAHNDRRAMLDALRLIAANHRKQQKIEQARECLAEALEVARGHGERATVAEMLALLGGLLEDVDPKQALAYERESHRIYEELRGERQRHKLAVLDMEQRISEEHKLHEQHRSLLLQLMPDEAVSRILNGQRIIADTYDDVSVMFLDIVGFTALASQAPAEHLVHLLNAVFERCDEICDRYELTKIKTIGDSYLAISGMPTYSEDHAVRLAHAALDLTDALRELEVLLPRDLGSTDWAGDFRELQVRIGLHRGPIVAGVIGKKRAQYDIWGDTVNVASRMESTALPGHIQVSGAFADAIRPHSNRLQLSLRGPVEIKGKGQMVTWWLSRNESGN